MLGQAMQVERPAGFRPGAGQALAAKWLDADHGTDHIPIDVQVAYLRPLPDGLDGFIDAAVDAHGQAVAGGVDLFEQVRQLVATETQDMHHRAEHLAVQIGQCVNFDQGRWHEAAGGTVGRQGQLENSPTQGAHTVDVGQQAATGLLVDDRADIGAQFGRIANAQLLHRRLQHDERAVGNVGLQAQHAQGGAALAGAVEAGNQDVLHHLLGQRRRIDDHGVLPARLGDQARPAAFGQAAVDALRHFGRASEYHALDARIGHQSCAHRFPGAGQELQHFARDTGLVQQGDSQTGDQWRLLGRLGEHRAAGRQRRNHLAHKDGERKIPRADADHRPRRYSGIGKGIGEQLLGVITAKIDRLAHFTNGITPGLAGLAHAQPKQFRPVRLKQIGRPQQDGSPCRRRSGMPPWCCPLGIGQCQFQRRPVRIEHPAEHVTATGRIGDGQALAVGRGARHQRPDLPLA